MVKDWQWDEMKDAVKEAGTKAVEAGKDAAGKMIPAVKK